MGSELYDNPSLTLMEEHGEPGCIPSSSSKIGRLWQKVKVKYQLVEYHALPEYLRDNEYILAYYRADWPLRETLLSIFIIHNETLNIWTHLLGFILFLCLTVYTAVKLPAVVNLPSLLSLPSLLHMGDLQRIPTQLMTALSSSLLHSPHLHLHLQLHETLSNCFKKGVLLHIRKMLSVCFPEALLSTHRSDQRVLVSLKDGVADMSAMFLQKPITRWPFFVFLGGAMFCLLASTTCHLLSCHSKRVAYIMLRLDYAGIAALISASFYPSVYYSFLCLPLLRNVYLITITLFGVATMVLSLFPLFQNPEYRKFRAALFFGMGISGVAPIVHKLILYHDEPAALYTTGYEILMGIFYGLGALVYATRVPERWKPGKFDIAGQSHQLFHVLVVAGAYTHYQAGLLYLKWRDGKVC